ncbi:MAG: hypothetical protein NTY57_01905 [Solirubrobacterales bacterium]|nr:hypothetical protein [Solirubrobacterales bacterium]
MFGALITLAISAAMIPATSAAALRAGDVGFSLSTQSGQTWVYGDSWNNGVFVRNAITLNDAYVGTLRGVPRGSWVWPGAPFELPNGNIAMYGAEIKQVKPGAWGFQIVGGVRADFDPAHAGRATVAPTIRPGIIWAAAATKDPASGAQYVYGIDGNHHAHVARANDNGTTTEIGTMGGTISGQFTVLQEPSGKWWMVGQLPFLSRRVVAYPLSGPAGKVTGAGLKLITLPSPGPTRYTYAGTVHPELNGLLTWAVNGSGAGTPYGLQRQAAFWPLALTYAKAAAAATAAAKAKIAIAGSAGNTVKIWASSKQAELESELATNAELDLTKNWLAPLPDPLSPDLSIPSSSAPAAWEMSGTASDPFQPAGEDSDTGGDFIVPETSAGFKAQQTLARAADSAAKAAVRAAAARARAAEAAKAAVERQAEANQHAAEALGEQAKKAAEKAAEQAKNEAEKAQAAAEKALERANNEAAKADEALKRANGKGRTNWGVLAPTPAVLRLIRAG